MYQNIFITSRTEHAASQVYVWDDKEGLLIYPWTDFNYAYREDAKGKHKSIFGSRLTKLKRYDPYEKGLFESDVSRETRVLTDLYLDSDDPSTGHNIGIFDIEVSTVGGFATTESADKEVTSIAIYNQNDDAYCVFLLDLTGTIEPSQNGNEYIIPCQTEVDLLESFMAYYVASKFTILSGWNIDNFDIPYLYHRMKKVLGPQMANRLSPINMLKYNEGREKYQIAGVSTLDYIKLYKKFTFAQRPSYRLDAIGKLEVGMGKVEYEGTLDDLYRTDLAKFIEYNLNDVRIVVALDKKMKLIELVRFICHLGHVPYEDYGYSSKFIEGTILTYLHRKGIIAPNKPEGGREAFEAKMDEDSEGFAGAFVRVPFPGVYEWVYSLDLTSLYPSIIMSLNISPDTRIGKVLNWNVENHFANKITEYKLNVDGEGKTLSKAEFDKFLLDTQYCISSNGVLYRTDKVGVIPEILQKWFAERVEYKNLMKQCIKDGNAELADYYDRRQHVQKILLNCFDPETMVVTPMGIRNIRDLSVGDMVYSLNPDTGTAEVKPVTRTFEYDYSGDMVAFKSTHVDFLTTPNHRFLLADANRKSSYRWILSGDVMNMATRQYFPCKTPLPGERMLDTFSLTDHYFGDVVIKDGYVRDNRLHTRFQPNLYHMNDWLEFMGWYISEGSSYTSTPKVFKSGNVRGVSNCVYIAQEKHHVHVKALLDGMGIAYSENAKGFKITSTVIHHVLTEQCGTHSHTKHLPRWVFSLHADQLIHLFNGLMMGDGDTRGQRYSTNSSQLAQDVVELCLRLGYQAFIIPDGELFRVQINKVRGVRPCLKQIDKALVPYDGKVYCVEVADNHTLLAGRNGKFNWVGQSIYGVLGLPIFRFYDLDNAEAVTATGQDVIKTTAKFVNSQYKKRGAVPKSDTWVQQYWELLREDAKRRDKPVPPAPSKEDWCVYTDTDSVYFSAVDLLPPDEPDPKAFTVKLAIDMENAINKFYDTMAIKLFNNHDHRFSIKGESVAITGLWVAKKRYALKKVYDLESNVDVDNKLKVTGLDVVRSSFPPAFQTFMKKVLDAILEKKDKDTLDKIILDFRHDLPKMNYLEIARNTSIKDIGKYEDKRETSFMRFPKGAPAHVKAALTYNRFLAQLGLDQTHMPIMNGDKIKWVYLKKNKYGMETMALKTYDDPPEVLELVEKYIDYDMLFEKELSNKLADFYGALKWGKLPTEVNQAAFDFFDFV